MYTHPNTSSHTYTVFSPSCLASDYLFLLLRSLTHPRHPTSPLRRNIVSLSFEVLFNINILDMGSSFIYVLVKNGCFYIIHHYQGIPRHKRLARTVQYKTPSVLSLYLLAQEIWVTRDTSMRLSRDMILLVNSPVYPGPHVGLKVVVSTAGTFANKNGTPTWKKIKSIQTSHLTQTGRTSDSLGLHSHSNTNFYFK